MSKTPYLHGIFEIIEKSKSVKILKMSKITKASNKISQNLKLKKCS